MAHVTARSAGLPLAPVAFATPVTPCSPNGLGVERDGGTGHLTGLCFWRWVDEDEELIEVPACSFLSSGE